MKDERVLMTGFRLLSILEILYYCNSSKSEILQLFNDKFIKDFSRETIKLDIKNLLKAGFKITRGDRKTKFRFNLDRDFVMLKLTMTELFLLVLIKTGALEFFNYKQNASMQALYRKMLPCVQKGASRLYDFEYFNLVNKKILKDIEKSINIPCTIVYNSPEEGKVEFEAVPREIKYKNGKVYIQCYTKKYGEKTTLRIDNIETFSNETKIMKKAPEMKIIRNKMRYTITKKYYESLPLDQQEKVISNKGDKIVIETDESNDFFISQRILYLGKNCVGLDSLKMKKRVLKSLEESLELYK